MNGGAATGRPVLDVRDLVVALGGARQPVVAVDGVSLRIHAGECVALVGESGSGKSVFASSLVKLLPSPPVRRMSGEVWLAGRELLGLSETELRGVRGRGVAYVFQEPGQALNPVCTIGMQMAEAALLNQPGADVRGAVLDALRQARMPEPLERWLGAYPHELSGGLQQRAVLAMALACRPVLLVADEPTTALDVTVQKQILELLNALKREQGLAVLFITHNLALVPGLAERVCVMKDGKIVEEGPVGELLVRPRHPYTQALIRAIPRLRPVGGRSAAPAGTDAA